MGSTWGRSFSLANVTGTDPGSGVAHPIPSGATQYGIYAIGSAGDRVLHRVAGSSSVVGLAAACFIGPVGVMLGPFDISPQADTHVQVSEAGTGITAYYISFLRK